MTQNFVEETRKAREWTRMKLSAECQVSEVTLYKIERYGFYPSEPTRAKISRALGVSEHDLWKTGEAGE